MKSKRKRTRKDKGGKHERPLSLAPLTFNQALDKLLGHRPKGEPKTKPTN
jgi:hypothetical protein